MNSIAAAIAGAAEEQSSSTAEVSRNMRLSAQGSATIVADVRGVADASANVAHSASVTRQAAGELRDIASALTALVGRFDAGV